MQFANTIGVELRGAAKTYRNAGAVVNAVRGIDVSIKRGETVALLGPNGAGKSTTIDLLLGLSPRTPAPCRCSAGHRSRPSPAGWSRPCSRRARSSATSRYAS